MGTFVTGNTPLPPLKTDAFPSTGSSSELDAVDINNLWGAAGDLRTAVIGSTSSVSSLTGDVTGTGPGATVTTVVLVGGSTAASVATATATANAATSLNTASTVVKRDAGGSFTAGTITANLTGNVTGNVTGNASGTASGLSATLAIASGGTGQVTAVAATNALLPAQTTNAGKVLTTDGTNTSWAAGSSGVSTLAAVGASPNANGADITGTTLTLEPANGAFPGLLTATGTQTIGGYKQFNSLVAINGLAVNATFPLNVGGAIIANNVANGSSYGLTMSNGVDATWTVIPAASGQVRMKTDGAGRWISIADGAGATDVFAIKNSRTLIGTTTDNGTDKLQVIGKASVSGNFGIGITNPGEPLDVYGTPTADGALSTMLLLANNSTAPSSNPSSGIDFAVNVAGGAVNGVAGIAGGKENATLSDTAGFLAFYTQANAGAKIEQARFDSSGRLVTKSGRIRNRTPVTLSYSALPTDHTIAYTALGGPRTVTLPTAAAGNVGQEYIIQDESGNTGVQTITIAAATGSVFGLTTITTAYGARTVYSNGTNWFAR